MIVFRGTQKLLKELRIQKTDLVDLGDGVLGSWFANLFRVERRKCVLFTNDRTLYSVLLFGLRKPDFDSLGLRFRDGLIANLQAAGLPAEQVASLGIACRTVTWGATNSRSVLGSMNDMISITKYMVAIKRHETEEEIALQNHQLNRMPMSSLKLVRPVDEMRAALEEWAP
jgi:hypothetical protein